MSTFNSVSHFAHIGLLALSLTACSSFRFLNQNDGNQEPAPLGQSAVLDDPDYIPGIEAQDIDVITQRIHRQLITVDTHVDIPLSFASNEKDPGTRGTSQVDLVKMEEGNLNAVFFIVYVPQLERDETYYDTVSQQALTKLDAIHRMAEELYPEKIEIAYSVRDVRRIRAEGKLVALIGVENASAFGGNLKNVEAYHKRGVRYSGFSHIGHNDFSDSSIPKVGLGDKEAEHNGLSERGKELLIELNRVGIMADVSHASKETTLQLTQLSRAPVIASHSGVKAVYDHPRNLTDEELLAIKGNGGVVQIVAFDTYLKRPPQEKVDAINALREKYGLTNAKTSPSPETIQKLQADMRELHALWPQATVSDFVDHIDYAVNLIGIDHVGIASDFDGGGGVDGWNDASETANVTKELISRGYSVGQIEKLWGENLLRVMQEVSDRAERKRWWQIFSKFPLRT